MSYCVDLASGVLKAEVTVNSGEDGGWGQKNRSLHVGDLRPRQTECSYETNTK